MICLACHAEHDDDALQCPRCRSGLRETATDARPRPNTAAAAPARPEAEIQAEIVAWLKLHGWDVTVTSAHTHAKGVTAGTPDLYCRRPTAEGGDGDRIWIEVKRPGGKCSGPQVAWAWRETTAGGRVIVAYGIEDVQQLA